MTQARLDSITHVRSEGKNQSKAKDAGVGRQGLLNGPLCRLGERSPRLTPADA